MKTFSNNNFKNDYSLSGDEHARMKRTLMEYMAMRPLPISPLSARNSPRAWSLFAWQPVAALLILAVFASSAGLSYAAEGALPGDALYTIKTNINEPVEGALATSVDAKTMWALNVAGERIKEAAILAAQDNLDTTTQEKLQSNFESHAQIAITGIRSKASSSPLSSTEDAVRFEARLSEYERVLVQIGEAKQVDVGVLASSINTQRARVSSTREEFQATSSIITASSTARIATASHMRASAKKQLQVTADLARASIGSLVSSSAENVDMQLQDASDTIAAGDDLLNGSSSVRAIGNFQDVLAASEKLGVFLETSAAITARTGLKIGTPTSTILRQSQNGQATSSVHIKYPSSHKTQGKIFHGANTAVSATSSSVQTLDAPESASGTHDAASQDFLPISVPASLLPTTRD